MNQDIQKNKLYVGRGTTSIYLILASNFKNKEVILPGNICYAAIFGVLYSGNIPRFCDIDDDFSGNTSLSKIRDVVNDNTGAIIFPYMYGNITSEIFEIKEYCDENNIILIEDCASSFGGQFYCERRETTTHLPKDVGSVGHYSFFSFGHAKNVDLGNGGILYSDIDMTDIEKLYASLPAFLESSNKLTEEFSCKYRSFLNDSDCNSIQHLFDTWSDMKDCFLYRLPNSFSSEIDKYFSQITSIKEERIGKYNTYKNMLSDCKVLNHTSSSLPWRFCIYVNDDKIRKKIVTKLLSSKLFVSDWYPDNSIYFSDDECPNCKAQGEQILNFSLEIEDDKIQQICEIINDTL